VKGILFDLDGVLYDGGRPIPGAAEAVTTLQGRGVPHRFLTNTTSRSRQALAERLARLGVTTSAEHIITPAFVAGHWLRGRGANNVALFVTESALQEFEGLPVLPNDAERGADYVVIGDLGEGWDYHTLTRAFRLLHDNPQAELVALGMSRYWRAEDGLRLDVAPFVAALEYASERRTLVLGKPSPAFFETALDDLGLPAAEVVMIGDDVEGDVGAAQSVGMQGILVRTGKYRPGDLERGITPDAVLDSLADLPAWWGQRANAGQS
jgi:HAD superfamily hydrolase (TIGR01458 family)